MAGACVSSNIARHTTVGQDTCANVRALGRLAGDITRTAGISTRGCAGGAAWRVCLTAPGRCQRGSLSSTRQPSRPPSTRPCAPSRASRRPHPEPWQKLWRDQSSVPRGLEPPQCTGLCIKQSRPGALTQDGAVHSGERPEAQMIVVSAEANFKRLARMHVCASSMPGQNVILRHEASKSSTGILKHTES